MNFVNLQPYEQDVLLESKLNIYLYSKKDGRFNKVDRFRPSDGDKYVLQHPEKGVLVMYMKGGNVYYNKYEGKFSKDEMKKLVKNFDKVLKCSCQSSKIYVEEDEKANLKMTHAEEPAHDPHPHREHREGSPGHENQHPHRERHRHRHRHRNRDRSSSGEGHQQHHG